ncbi:MAG: serine/threonine protein kinase, partial [Candidatus Competibacteraceae bacterium]|nr:serine/threonine protein kinase [Candidatus Competibacteraceae bacterium]
MLRMGQQLGAYRIEALLGRGAMGVVYRGVRLEDNQPVAIKTVHTSLLVRPERDAILTRFRQEAAIGMRLRHPLIVRIHDCGEQEGILYLTMQLVEGQELGRLVEHLPTLPLGMKLAIVLQVLNALAYAHQQGVIHRDIKPSNILVRRDYTIVLTDFGIAHVHGSELTHTGELLGSPLYMSPEQLCGAAIDERADLFSAGVVFYYLLTHRKPFIADSLPTLMYKVLQEEPPAPSTINQELSPVFDHVLRRALAKRLEQRFASALEFATALRQARIETLEATVAIPGGWRGAAPTLPPQTDPEQSTLVIPSAGDLFERIATLAQQCLTERTTRPRLAQLAEWLDLWFALQERAPSTADRDAERQRLLDWCMGEALAALNERIHRDAPTPGQVVAQARGDWLELIGLFALIQDIAARLGPAPTLDAARARLIKTLTGAVFHYANTLNRLLFSEDNPQLLRISADFTRLELLQLALEELGAEAQTRTMRQTLLLFANQVMSKINALIRQFLDDRNPLARFEVTSLLVEVEEMIVLAERLLEWGAETAAVEAMGSGGTTMIEFLDSAQALGQLLVEELVQQFTGEQKRALQLGPGAFSTGQAAFVGRIRQLGLLYRFAIRLEPSVQTTSLHDLTAEVYHCLEQLATGLLQALEAVDALQTATATDPLWARLSVIAELAEQFAWRELQQRVLVAIRRRV